MNPLLGMASGPILLSFFVALLILMLIIFWFKFLLPSSHEEGRNLVWVPLVVVVYDMCCGLTISCLIVGVSSTDHQPMSIIYGCKLSELHNLAVIHRFVVCGLWHLRCLWLLRTSFSVLWPELIEGAEFFRPNHETLNAKGSETNKVGIDQHNAHS